MNKGQITSFLRIVPVISNLHRGAKLFRSTTPTKATYFIYDQQNEKKKKNWCIRRCPLAQSRPKNWNTSDPTYFFQPEKNRLIQHWLLCSMSLNFNRNPTNHTRIIDTKTTLNFGDQLGSLRRPNDAVFNLVIGAFAVLLNNYLICYEIECINWTRMPIFKVVFTPFPREEKLRGKSTFIPK